MSKRIALTSEVSMSPDVRTSITVDEYEKCKKLISDKITVTKKDTKYELTQTFSDVKERVMTGFNKLSVEEKDVLALREYKTRDFQDSVRADLRAQLELSTSTSTGARKLAKKLTSLKESDPKKFALLMADLEAKLSK